MFQFTDLICLVDDFEDLRKMAVWSGRDPRQLPVLPCYDGAHFSDVFMKELQLAQEDVGMIKTGVKPSDDLKLELRKQARPGGLAIIDVQSSHKIVPNLSSKLKVTVTEINGNSGVPFEIIRRGKTGDGTEIRVQVDRSGKYKVEVELYKENLGNSPLVIEVAEETSGDSSSGITARALRRQKVLEVISKKKELQESSIIKFPDLLSKGRVIKTVQMKIDSARSQRGPAETEARLDGAIGLCVLDTERVAVASTGEDKVKIFTMEGEFVQLLQPEVPFKRPSDMLRPV